MSEDRVEEETSKCRGCDGTGFQPIARQFMSLDTGEVKSVWAKTRCRHCRDGPEPGRQRGGGGPM